jgi:hypothetical protein
MTIILRMPVFAALLIMMLTGCALISNPEKSGGEIIAVPEGSGCQFNISGNGDWLQYLGDSFEEHPEDRRSIPNQRQAWFVNLDTGETGPASPDPEVADMIREGIGPAGIGCFSPDHNRAYFTRVIFDGERKPENVQNQAEQSQTRTSLSIPSRQADRYHFMVDLNQSPLTISRTGQTNCMERPAPVKPNIRVEQRSEKRIHVYSPGGTLLESHRPRGLTSKRISMWELDNRQWEHNYFLSPDGNYLAYLVSETGPIGFSAPTHGYLADLHSERENSARFLAASVYRAQWSSRNHLFACTSHLTKKNVIARWIP